MKQGCFVVAALSFAMVCGNGVGPFAEGQSPRTIDPGTLSPGQEAIGNVVPPATAGGVDSLQVVAWVDRSDSTYVPGERVRIFVQTSTDAYVHVLNVTADGATTILFPNQYQPDNFVRGGRPTEVAAPGSGGQVMVSEALGTELLKAMASTRRVSLFQANQLRGAGPFQRVSGRAESTARTLERSFNIQVSGAATSGPGGQVSGTTTTGPGAQVSGTTTTGPSYQPAGTEWAVCNQTIETVPRRAWAAQQQRTLVPQTVADGGAATCLVR